MTLTKKQKQLQIKILDKIYAQGPISRIDISKETTITPATVSDITGRLMDDGIVIETGELISDENKSGRKKVLLDINPTYQFFIGSELSEKYLSFCLTNSLGKPLKEKTIVFQDENERHQLTSSFYIDSLLSFIEDCSDYTIAAIGIALPGHHDPENHRIKTNNPFWQLFDLKSIEDAVDCPVFFENNVNGMTIAERLFSLEKQNNNFLFFHISRGMFCTYLYNGSIYAQDNKVVGEVGHLVVNPDGELCECGKRGCLQTFASEAWIIKKSQFLYDNSPQTYLRQLVKQSSDITIQTILKAYHLGDEGIITILHNAIKYIATTINNLSIMLDSDMIYIHGELFLEKQLTRFFKEELSRHLSLFASSQSQQLILKPYTNLNGAIGACGVCVNQLLLTIND